MTARLASGLTLMEMLVTLVLVSLVGTLLIQGVGFFTARYDTVKRTHREEALAMLSQHWFLTTVRGLVPYGVEARRFDGDATSFAGITLQPLNAEPGMIAEARWAIVAEDAVSVVTYQENDGEVWEVLILDAAEAVFEYADSTRQWHDRWPFPGAAAEWIPSGIRLVSETGRPIWLASAQATPRPSLTEEDFR